MAFQSLRNQRQRLFAGFVERNHLECPFCRDCNEVGCHLFVGRVCNLALEYVGLEVEVCIIGCFQTDVFGWHLSYAFYIGIDLEVETAFQLCTLARQLLGLSEMSWNRAALVATLTKLVIQVEQHRGRPHGPIPPMRPAS